MHKSTANCLDKNSFQLLLSETLMMVEKSYKETNRPLWNCIANQLKDINEIFILQKKNMNWDDVYDRYTLPQIANAYFKEDDEMHMRLCKIFYGAVHYSKLK